MWGGHALPSRKGAGCVGKDRNSKVNSLRVDEEVRGQGEGQRDGGLLLGRNPVGVKGGRRQARQRGIRQEVLLVLFVDQWESLTDHR